eukprot:304136-Chlamydomonas_euryale.AAC.1
MHAKITPWCMLVHACVDTSKTAHPHTFTALQARRSASMQRPTQTCVCMCPHLQNSTCPHTNTHTHTHLGRAAGQKKRAEVTSDADLRMHAFTDVEVNLVGAAAQVRQGPGCGAHGKGGQ